MKNIQLKDYSEFQGDLKGAPYEGTISVINNLPFVYTAFHESFTKMTIYNERHIGKVYYDVYKSSWLPHSRNVLSTNCIGEWCLMLDVDHTFDPDLAENMLKVFTENKLQVLTGVYLYKKKPFWPAIYTWDKTKKKYQTVKDWITDSEDLGLFEVQAAGAGCLMVAKWVFGYIRQELKEEPFTPRKPFDNQDEEVLGEDLSFFDRCRQLDIQVVCDPRITIGHLTPNSVEVGKEYNPHKVRKI